MPIPTANPAPAEARRVTWMDGLLQRQSGQLGGWRHVWPLAWSMADGARLAESWPGESVGIRPPTVDETPLSVDEVEIALRCGVAGASTDGKDEG